MSPSSHTQTVHSCSIYHGLPTFPSTPPLTNLTAIITGANGISGHYMLRVLSKSPTRWTKIFCLSRRPPMMPEGLPAHVEHIALDFLQSPDAIADTLKSKNVTADYIFFFSYIQPPPREGQGLWSDAEEMVRINEALLSNFLSALPRASIKPKRVMLQTGAKNYGGHLGPTKVPQVESDARVLLEPNFYYAQEDKLFEYCAHEGVGWNVAMPGPILGAVPEAAMNAAFPLAVYASVCKELDAKLEFPGDIPSWTAPQSMSSSMMNAYLEEWAVLTPDAKDQRFNAFDDSSFTWEGFWPILAGWYGIEWKGPQEDSSLYKQRETRFCPRGYGGKGKVRTTFTMVSWAKRPEVVKAWGKIAEKAGLKEKELRDGDRVFGFLDGTLCRAGSLYMSMGKARKLGWHGFVDSSESLLEVFRDLAALKMIPPVPEADFGSD